MDQFNLVPIDIYKLIVKDLGSLSYLSLMSTSSLGKRKLLNLYHDEVFCSMRLSHLNLRDYNNKIGASITCRVSDLAFIFAELPMLIFDVDPTLLCISISLIDMPLCVPDDAIEFIVFKHNPTLYAKLFTYCYSKALYNREENAITYKPYLEFVGNNPNHLHQVLEACIDEDNYKLAHNLLLSLIPIKVYNGMEEVVLSVHQQIQHYGSYELLCTLKGQLTKLGVVIKELQEDPIYYFEETRDINYYTNIDRVIIQGSKPYKLIYMKTVKANTKPREISFQEYQRLYFVTPLLDINVTGIKSFIYGPESRHIFFLLGHSSCVEFAVSRYRDEIKSLCDNTPERLSLSSRLLYIITRYKLLDDDYALMIAERESTSLLHKEMIIHGYHFEELDL